MNNSFYKIIDINLEKIWGQKIIDNKTIGEIIKFEINEKRSNNLLDNLGNRYNLYELYSSLEKDSIFGVKYHNIDTFPFLIKYIYSSKKLSVQVHPKEKKEVWLFLKDDSKILIGLKKELNKDNISVDTLLSSVNVLTMPKYGFAIVEPGTIHALLEDNIVCEVQNNYDVTYRYYDWDNNRKLTKEEFIANTNFKKYDIQKNILSNFNKYNSQNFHIKKISINGKQVFSKIDCCHVLIVLEGNGVLKSSEEMFNISSEESYLIVSNASFTIEGNLEVLLIS